MAKKDFTKARAVQGMTERLMSHEEEPKEEKPAPKPKAVKKRETKSYHVHFLMKPSLHERGVKAAEDEGMSFSELLTTLLEEYLEERK